VLLSAAYPVAGVSGALARQVASGTHGSDPSGRGGLNMTSETTGQKQRPQLFKKGQSGNPAGRPKGSRHKATLAVEALLDGEAENITRKAVEMALSGDTTAMRLVLERICSPRRDRPVTFALPKLEIAADAVKATAAIAAAVATGDLTPTEAGELSKLVDGFRAAFSTAELEARIVRLENRQ
jgi:hypothetical protein